MFQITINNPNSNALFSSLAMSSHMPHSMSRQTNIIRNLSWICYNREVCSVSDFPGFKTHFTMKFQSVRTKTKWENFLKMTAANLRLILANTWKRLNLNQSKKPTKFDQIGIIQPHSLFRKKLYLKIKSKNLIKLGM